MADYKRHLIDQDATLMEGLARLNMLAADTILFVVDQDERLVGSLTDGDVRRGLLKGLQLDSHVRDFIAKPPRVIKKGNYTVEQIIEYREKDLRIIPVIDHENRMHNIINFRYHKSYLPIDAIVMAGGRGERLKPLTDETPKPLLKVGDKPIIEHNIDRLLSFGIDDIWISVRYLGEQICDYLKDGSEKGACIDYLWEDEPLGTIGAASKVKNVTHDYVLVTNSDVLTNLNYEDFFLDFQAKNAMLSVVTIPYNVEVPYAVLEMDDTQVRSFKEKPTYTYYSNGGIYLMKKECLDLIPKDAFFNATDLMETLIQKGEKVASYPLRGYWLDIGKHEDYKKAQEDVKYITF
jgi:dTDP-glucose pyrophosphorylase